MAFFEFYVVLVMVTAAATQQADANFTEQTVAETFAEVREKPQLNSSATLTERRAACFQAAAEYFAASASHPAAVAENDSLPLHPSGLPESGLTCDSSLLVHHTLAEFWTTLFSDVSCQQREVYKEMTGCLLEASKSCWTSDHIQELLPHEDKVRDGLEYLCDVSATPLFDVDVGCAQSLSAEVLSCLHRDLQEAVGTQDLVFPTTGNIHPRFLCRSYDIADLCYWETLAACGRQTSSAFTRMVSLYFRPPYCISGSSALKWRVDYTFACLVFAFVVSRLNLMQLIR